MSDMEGPDGSFETDSSNSPSYNPPWPHVDSFSQGRFERQYLADGETIDFDSVPHLPFWSSWLGLSENYRVYTTLSRVSIHSIGAHRPLTGAEANAIAEHNVRSCLYMVWAKPVCIVSAAMLAWRGRKTFSFPMYEPKMKRFDPYSFPWSSLRVWRGPRAALAWHVVRMCAYLPFTWFPTTFVFFSMANSSFKLHAINDPRLTGVIEDTRRNLTDGLKPKPQIQERWPNATHSVGLPNPQNPQNTGYEAHQDSTPQFYENDSFASQPSDGYETSNTASKTSQAARTSWGQDTFAQSAPQKVQKNTSPMSHSRHEDDDLDIFDEQDSPSATSGKRGEAGSSSPPRSAWERIRQQASSGSSAWEKGDSSGQESGWGRLRQDKTPTPRDFTPKTENYSYSNDEEEKERRNYEKEKAQKEFDAMVEAERRGDSGGSSSSSRGGWKSR